MSTRGNIVFANQFFIEDKQMGGMDFHFVKSDDELIKNSYSIYVHSDMYPSGALKDLQAFLNLDGAKRRATDTSYLSAWFVGWKCLDMSRWTRRMDDRDFNVDKCKNPSLKNFKESKDFFGIGLLNEPSDWTSYSYLIVPEIRGDYHNYEKNSFNIYIYDGCFDKYLAKVNSKDILDFFENEDWWY